ncbi:hypothetical protein C0J52_15278 [Blattella germanica]|nr:hypothetical protein C0J52_15278 [Blattella germanica]
MDTNILVFRVVLQVLQRDIETHGKIVCSVVKLCEKIVRADPSKGHYDTAHAYKVARSLERRWHFLYLRSLEWQCHLETLAGKLRNTQRLQELPFNSDIPCVKLFPDVRGRMGVLSGTDGSQ